MLANFCKLMIVTLSVSLLVAVSSQENETSRDEVSHEKLLSVRMDPAKLPIVSRTREFNSLGTLVRQSDAIVTGQGTSEITLHPGSIPEVPMADLSVTVTKGFKGALRQGDAVDVLVESYFDDSGELATNKIESGETYLLFLTALNDGSGAYAVTGYLSGLFKAVGESTYGKVDPESPSLPDGVTDSDVQAAVVKER